MKSRAGFLTVVCAWVGILMQSLDAGHAPKKHADGVSCRAKELTALTKSLVDESLTGFDKANGAEHLGTWFPGFPEFEADQNSPPNGSKVQCSLLFMAQGLEKVLKDQRNNLNPTDVSLHEKLRFTISNVNLLTACVKNIFVGECSLKPTPSNMPKNAFKRKQWCHTLLKTARDYLDWLEYTFEIQISKVKGKNEIKRKVPGATLQKYLEGSRYLL